MCKRDVAREAKNDMRLEESRQNHENKKTYFFESKSVWGSDAKNTIIKL